MIILILSSGYFEANNGSFIILAEVEIWLVPAYLSGDHQVLVHSQTDRQTDRQTDGWMDRLTDSIIEIKQWFVMQQGRC
jgi:hypothetical protein